MLQQTHFAPETLMYGEVTPSSDVYAFGILLYELYTGNHAFQGVPKCDFVHEVGMGGLRPKFPPSTPPAFQMLAAKCWEETPSARPSFEQLLTDLHQLAQLLAQRSATCGMPHELMPTSLRVILEPHDSSTSFPGSELSVRVHDKQLSAPLEPGKIMRQRHCRSSELQCSVGLQVSGAQDTMDCRASSFPKVG